MLTLSPRLTVICSPDEALKSSFTIRILPYWLGKKEAGTITEIKFQVIRLLLLSYHIMLEWHNYLHFMRWNFTFFISSISLRRWSMCRRNTRIVICFHHILWSIQFFRLILESLNFEIPGVIYGDDVWGIVVSAWKFGRIHVAGILHLSWWNGRAASGRLNDTVMMEI